MAARDTLRRNKVNIQSILSGDRKLILNKVLEKELITRREYNNLKSINKEDEEGHVTELVDKIMNKGNDTCQRFLGLLQTDEDIKTTYPELRDIQLNDSSLLPQPVQASSADSSDGPSQGNKKPKLDERYQLNSQPTGLCVIINNEKFTYAKLRRGTDKDAESLAKVFSWLGFRVLMCKDQTKDQMDQVLKYFASLSGVFQPEFDVKEWSGSTFTDLQEAPQHGDAFVCCVLSHGKKSVVLGTDSSPLSIKQITTHFKATTQSALTGKPKVFLIQACQGLETHPGVLSEDLEADDSYSQYIPEEADFLVAIATVEDFLSYRHEKDGSWFIQSVCQQLEDGCRRGDNMSTILLRVNNEVSQKEGAKMQPGAIKQMSEVRHTLRKTLVLSPHCN